MITSDQAGEILGLARNYADTRIEWHIAEVTRHPDAERRLAIAQQADADLCRYIRDLVMPDSVDEDALRERVQAINASVHHGPTFDWTATIDPEQIRRTIDALNAKPPEWWQDIARQIEERAKAGRPWDLGRAFGVTLSDQDQTDRGPAMDNQGRDNGSQPKEYRTPGHHGGN